MKKAIAMRCTQEQFEAIKPKLEGLLIDITKFQGFPYLVNNFNSIELNISNTLASTKGNYNREVHEEWNEKVFLQACGIETEQEYTITKEQVIDLINAHDIDDITRLCKEWFPEVFETVLQVGKWYKRNGYDKIMFCFNGKIGYYTQYGFNMSGEWSEDLGIEQKKINSGIYREATESEVFEALKNEAVKRGYKIGNHKCLNSPIIQSHLDDVYGLENGLLWYGGKYANCVFKDGKWAEIIPTLTRKEAENKLGVKIVD